MQNPEIRSVSPEFIGEILLLLLAQTSVIDCFGFYFLG